MKENVPNQQYQEACAKCFYKHVEARADWNFEYVDDCPCHSLEETK